MFKVMLGLGLAAALVSRPAQAQSPAKTTLGEASCATWTSERDDNTPIGRLSRVNDLSWALGYLSRSAALHDGDMLRKVEKTEIALNIDAYCDAHPLESLSQAADHVDALLLERIRRRP